MDWMHIYLILLWCKSELFLTELIKNESSLIVITSLNKLEINKLFEVELNQNNEW